MTVNAIKTKNHLEVLKERKKELDNVIQKAYTEWADDEFVHQLKIKKLHLKDEITKYEKQLEAERGQ